MQLRSSPCESATVSTVAAPFVVLDACVLMSLIVRQLLLRIARAGVFRPVWSERIGDEWRRNAARLWAHPDGWLDAQWAEMNRRFPQAMERDIAAYEAGLKYSDPKDFHVIAAGLARRARCGAQTAPVVRVMTWNLKDFNRPELRRQGLDAFSPDVMLARWWDDHAAVMASEVARALSDHTSMGRPAEPLANVLRRERLFRLAAKASAI